MRRRERGPADPVLIVPEQLRRPVPGGIGTYSTALLAALQPPGPAGVEVPPLALYASRAPRGPDPLTRYGWPVRTSSLPTRLATRAWSAGLGPAPPAAVVHCVSLAAPPTTDPLVVVVHDLLWRDHPAASTRRGRRWHERGLERARRRAARLVVPSAAVADRLVGAGVPGDRVVVVPWGSDHLPPPDLAGADRLLARLGVGTGEPFLLSVGTLEPRKNLAGLVAAYRLARPRLDGRWPLVVVGPRGWGKSLPSGSDDVLPVGRVDDAVLAGLLARARLLAYVPWQEGFGFPPLEAMAAGIPVVASPMPSTGGAALEVDPGDVPAIAAALVAAATDRGRRDELVAAGRAVAAARPWSASARAHIELWGTLR